MKKRTAIGLGTAVLVLGLAGVYRHNVAKYPRQSEVFASAPTEMKSDAAASGGSQVVSAFKSSSRPNGGMAGSSGRAAATVSAPTSGGASYASDSDKYESGPKLTMASMTDTNRDRYLVKNAVTSIEAKDVVEAANKMRLIAGALSGYVSTSHESVDNLGLRSEALEIRVPAAQFDSAMGRVAQIGKVLDNQVTSEDVTEQYLDTDAALRNDKETEARLLEHLKKTGKLSDTLLVETELSRVRASANELEGKMKFMSHRISYSTINLTFREPGHIEPIAPTESFSIAQVTSQAMRSLTGFLQQLMSALTWVGIWSVLWLPLVLVARLSYRKHKPTITRWLTIQR